VCDPPFRQLNPLPMADVALAGRTLQDLWERRKVTLRYRRVTSDRVLTFLSRRSASHIQFPDSDIRPGILDPTLGR
jgi:hypothetical protein